MVKIALLVWLEANPVRDGVEAFLCGGQPIVEDEPATITWYGIKLGSSTFGIFDTFPDDAGRQAYLAGSRDSAAGESAPNCLQSADHRESRHPCGQAS